MRHRPSSRRRPPVALLAALLALAAGSADGATALFRSGFESGVALGPVANGWQAVLGRDASTGFSWPISAWGAASHGIQVLDSTTANAIQTVIGHTGAPTAALLLRETATSAGDGQDDVVWEPTTTLAQQGDVYTSEWLRFQDDLSTQLISGQRANGDWGNWRSVWEMKTGGQGANWGGDFRTIVLVSKSDAGGLFWSAAWDNVANGGAAKRVYWSAENHAIAVPVGRWFRLETFTHRAGDATGRFWAKVDGAVLFDHSGPNLGVDRLPINRVFPALVYCNANLPAFEWVDDLEIWDGVPDGGGDGGDGATHGLLGQYWSAHARDFAGNPTLTRVDATVDFDWGQGAPAATVSSDDFTARWTGSVVPPTSGDWTFTVTGDDGVRLWIDGALRIDAWYDQPPTDHVGTVTLTGGQRHDLRLEYYERGGGAVARLAWASATTPRTIVPASALFPSAGGSGLLAQYWSGQAGGFAGAPTVIRIDAGVDADWGTGSPDARVAPDDFSARWSGDLVAPVTGDYTVTVIGDDGVRLWLGGALVIDAWYDQAATAHAAVVHLVGGERMPVRLDFYERGGLAVARLRWASDAVAPAPIPASALLPVAAPAGDEPAPPSGGG